MKKLKIIELKTKSITGKQYQKNVHNYNQNKKQFIYFNPFFRFCKDFPNQTIFLKKYNNEIITVNNNEKLSCGT
jgi:hypothetical protein